MQPSATSGPSSSSTSSAVPALPRSRLRSSLAISPARPPLGAARELEPCGGASTTSALQHGGLMPCPTAGTTQRPGELMSHAPSTRAHESCTRAHKSCIRTHESCTRPCEGMVPPQDPGAGHLPPRAVPSTCTQLPLSACSCIPAIACDLVLHPSCPCLIPHPCSCPCLCCYIMMHLSPRPHAASLPLPRPPVEPQSALLACLYPYSSAIAQAASAPSLVP